MSWVFLSLVAAVFEAVKDLLCKRVFDRASPELVAWAMVAYSIPFVAPFVLSAGIPECRAGFWSAVVGSCLIDVVGVTLYVRAISRSDLSLCLPLLMFTPLFMLLTSPLMLGEIPSLIGCCGVLLIIVGSYVLNITASSKGIWEPFKALFSNSGAQMMLSAAVLFSVGCNLHKLGTLASTPLWYVFVHQIILAVFLAPAVLRKEGLAGFRVEKSVGITFGLVGICVAILVTAQFTAFLTGFAVYSVALKRVSVLVGICLGCFVLREGGFRERMAGASIMVVGAVLTAV